MGHFRLGSLVLVEEIIKTLCIQTPIIIQDMCILLCDHRSLCMAGVTLNGFDITAVQFEFVCNTGVSEAMKDHFGEKDGSDTAVCFGAFQNLNSGTAGTQ